MEVNYKKLLGWVLLLGLFPMLIGLTHPEGFRVGFLIGLFVDGVVAAAAVFFTVVWYLLDL